MTATGGDSSSRSREAIARPSTSRRRRAASVAAAAAAAAAATATTGVSAFVVPSITSRSHHHAAGSRWRRQASAVPDDDSNNKDGAGGGDDAAQDAKDRAMAALSRPGGLPDPPAVSSTSSSSSKTESAEDTSGSILPPLPGYEESGKADDGDGDDRNNVNNNNNNSSSSSSKSDRRGRQQRRPHVKMKRRSGQRPNQKGGDDGGSDSPNAHKPSSFSSSVATPSSLLPPPPPSSFMEPNGGDGSGASWEEDERLFEFEKRRLRNQNSGGRGRGRGSGSYGNGYGNGSRRKGGGGGGSRSGNGRRDNRYQGTSSSSLLPPLLEGEGNNGKSSGGGNRGKNDGSSSSSDWDDWFQEGIGRFDDDEYDNGSGGGSSGSANTRNDNDRKGASRRQSSSSSASSFSLLPDLPPMPLGSRGTVGGGDGDGDAGSTTSGRPVSADDLPSVADLFAPSSAASSKTDRGGGKRASTDSTSDSSSDPLPGSALEGVIPVSDLFYRSTQSLSSDESKPRRRAVGDDDGTHDDEELPFSIEQSDRLSTDGNKIRIRRNQVQGRGGRGAAAFSASTSSSGGKRRSDRRGRRGSASGAGRGRGRQQKKSKGRRKMVRKGMEMLVGGEPINADPPLRVFELYYNRGLNELEDNDVDLVADDAERSSDGSLITTEETSPDWANTITLSSRDFGPLLHYPSVSQVSKLSRGLYCENFVHSALKWKICAKDFRDIVKVHELTTQQKERQQSLSNQGAADSPPLMKTEVGGPQLTEATYDFLLSDVKERAESSSKESTSDVDSNVLPSNEKEDELDVDEDKGQRKEASQPPASKGFGRGAGFGSARQKPKKGGKKDRGFGSPKEEKHMSPPSSFHTVESLHDMFDNAGSTDYEMVPSNRKSRRRHAQKKKTDNAIEQLCLGGELRFIIGVTRAELESGHDGGSASHILRRVLSKGIAGAINAEERGIDVTIAKLILKEVDGGSTDVDIDFLLTPKPGTDPDPESQAKRMNKLNAELAQVMDDGEITLSMAAAAKQEKGWSSKIRERIVEEFLFEEDDEDEEGDVEEEDEAEGDKGTMEDTNKNTQDQSSVAIENTIDDVVDKKADKEYDGPFGMPGDTVYAKDDIYLGGGNGGVFYDYSEPGIEKSPFKGDLGPLLVDAATQRAIQRQPRVIAIGDVHGCLDELQMLLRRCDYQPGDLVLFLGDLVSKGPDSLSVVQMAREIGAVGVRGNHDFEVIRWHQAMKSGADPPVIGSEHFHIASGLSKADLKWMYSLPWYISSKELGALFVHAGFVSGIRLSKQNPRLMMNMRSILPDGTVTSKFFNNWPWARLWDGPQTVLFGHDADRGLQQYEHAIGLDTGCVYGGRLTACILPEKRLVSVSAKREYFQYRRKHFD